MESVVLLALRIGLLVLLWFFIFMALRALRNDVSPTVPTTTARRSSGAVPLSRPQPPHRILVVGGPSEGTWMDLTGVSELVIGRDPQCTFVVGDDSTTRQHARLFQHSGEWFIEDLASRNGTFVAGVPIDQPERVGVNTDIVLGTTTVRLVP